MIDEAVRNAVAVGADPARHRLLLDNFCWGDPQRPETLGSLVEAARGCHEAALLFGAPFISGKDSLNNEYLAADGLRHAIPPTLVISALGVMDDLGHGRHHGSKDGRRIALPGWRASIRAWEPAITDWSGRPIEDFDGEVPPLIAAHATGLPARCTAPSSTAGAACHDLSEGGLAVAAAEMCIGGRLGMQLDLGGFGGGVPLCSLWRDQRLPAGRGFSGGCRRLSKLNLPACR